MKKIVNTKNIMRFIFLTFVGSTVFIAIRIALAPSVAPASKIATRVKGDYVLMFVQCLLGIVLMMFPGYLRHKVNLDIPNAMMIAYAVFLYCGIYLGEVRNFYYNVPHWDTVLHTFSGAALGTLGFSLVSLLNKSESVTFSLSPIFVAVFSFCFALSLGAIWEIYEFAIDFMLNTNTQKYALESGELLCGQAALADTMKDMIVDAIGAFAVSAVGYVSLRYNKGWLERLHIKLN
ncbi:MAG: hypothetical protein FWH48_10900 [Oscillospiraceae bacterium]|nr:hypothetical protein [Oscillospiraceae bacterium]